MSRKPQLYNIAADCVDQKALDPSSANRAALVFVAGDVSSGAAENAVKITYSSLKKLTDRAAQVFRAAGLEPGSRIIIRLPNTAEFAIAFLGAIKAGCLPVPVSPQLTRAECQAMLDDANAAAFVSKPDKVFVSLMARTRCRFFAVAASHARLPKKASRLQEEMLKHAGAFQTGATRADDPAFWLYTSGTLGVPRAVVHAHRSIPAHDARVALWLGFRPGDVVFNTGGMSWSYGLTCGFLDVLRHGGTALFYDGPPEADNLLHCINRYGVTTLMSVPGVYRRLLDYLSTHHVAFSRLRACLAAADTLSPELADAFFARTGRRIHQGFGMTEHSVYVFQPQGIAPIPGAIGMPYDPNEVKILKPDGGEAAVGEAGVIATRKKAPGLMLGYVVSGKTVLPERGGWFVSGDEAVRDAEGNFHFIGRSDDMINAGGFRVSPAEIESVLLRHPAVKEAGVFGVARASGGVQIAAAVILKPKVRPLTRCKSEIMEFCARYLAPYKIPKQILFAKSLPRTGSGKLKRKLLGKVA